MPVGRGNVSLLWSPIAKAKRCTQGLTILDAALPRDGAVSLDVDVHVRLLPVVAAVAEHLLVVRHAAGPIGRP